jgi:hypothetical protein
MSPVPPSLKANVNPAMLMWAQDDSGHTLEMAAGRTGYRLERLNAWEQGSEKPSIPQADVHRRPLSSFFMPNLLLVSRRCGLRRMPDADDPRWWHSGRAKWL